MKLPDFINGLFEFLGSISLWVNIVAICRDKGYKGVRIAPATFFFLWGVWNLYYYPHLDQWLSFVGGASLTLANLVWIFCMFYFGRNK